jgi:N-acetylmuramoyl-L-alanine amidase
MLLSAALCAGADKPVGLRTVRFYSSPQTTTITVELEAPVTPHKGSVGNPPRVFFDLPNTRVLMPGRGTHVIPVGDGVVSQIRVAQYSPSTARVVLELERDASVELRVLADPVRLSFEVRPTIPKAVEAASKAPEPAAPSAPSAPEAKSVTKPPEAGANPGVSESPRPAVVLANPPVTEAPPPKPAEGLAAQETRTAAAPGKLLTRPKPESATADMAKNPESVTAETAKKPAPAEMAESTAAEGSKPVPAGRNSGGGRTLTRALGLKLARVVIDAGHGGHDEGTRGPTGLLEKDLVLDVAQRLGALIEEQMGAEVVYTRTSNVFVPLEERTAIANRSEADLFLSLHANSSPYRAISGSEVYYLSFTTSKEALDVAARENAGTDKSIHELEDLLKKIALSEKVTESSEFASRIQRELYGTWNKLSGVTRNRGVKKAPFVVLIGANMPSVLAEIGFISNPHDESLLKKPEQRQRIAEALYRGVNAYASTLSRMDTPAEARQAAR